MKIKIHYKKLLLIIAIVVPALLLCDIVLDTLKHKLDWGEVFGFMNILQKFACALILGYFLATSKKTREQQPNT